MKIRSKPVLLLLISFTLFVSTGFSFFSLEYTTVSNEPTEYEPAGYFPFSDVQGHWAEAVIVEMFAKDVMNGYNDGTFRPNKPATLLEALVMIDRLLKLEVSELDVTSNQYLNKIHNVPAWAVGYVGVALRNEILLYNEIDKVSLQQPLTRQDATVLAVRALELTQQVRKKTNVSLHFTDSFLIPDEIKGYIAVALERRLINGFPDGSFQPTNPISRAEMSMLLSNIAGQLPYTTSDETAGFIKSIDTETNTITIINHSNNEKTVYLSLNYRIYLNNKPAALSELTPDNHLRVISKQVGDVNFTVLSSKTVAPDYGVIVKTNSVNVNQEIDEIKQWIEKNKASENYLLYKTPEHVYIFVSRGEKKTGGYTVKIVRVTSQTDESGGIHYKVWLRRTDPDRNSLLTQVISYPYDVVRIDSPLEQISTVTYVDEINHEVIYINNLTDSI